MTSALDEYRRHAADHGAHMLKGEADASNASYDRLQDAFRLLVEQGKRKELFKLYNDLNLHVQGWAAAHTLEIDEQAALTKLGELQKSDNPHVSTDAKYTIQEWKTGQLRFLPS